MNNYCFNNKYLIIVIMSINHEFIIHCNVIFIDNTGFLKGSDGDYRLFSNAFLSGYINIITFTT